MLPLSVVPTSAVQRRRLCLGVGAWLAHIAVGAQAVFPASLTLTRIAQGIEVRRTEEALRQAYANLHIALVFVEMPPERALVESNAGRVDGETIRIGGLENLYPGLRRVDVPMYINTNSIFVYGAANTAPGSLAQLAQLPRVGIIGGWKASEDATAGWTNVVRVTSHLSAIQMLKLGRLDAFLGRGEDTLRALQQEGWDMKDFPSKVIARGPVFHYLHKKHEALLPAITQELRRMKGNKEAVVEGLTPHL